MGYADLHIHSVHSHDGTCSISAILKYAADNTNLDVIAITDHDSVRGIKEAVALGPKYGIDVIPGCEVSTAQGHLLALFITGPVPCGLSLSDTITIVGKMGGICVVPHPDAPGIGGMRAQVVRAAAADPQLAQVLLGIETYNGGLVFPQTNQTAGALCRSLNLASLGSSDAHILGSVGQGTTEFPGRSAAELREAITARETVAHSGIEQPGPIVLGRWFPHFLLRKMGWVSWNEYPQAPLRYVRMEQALAWRAADS